MEHARRIPLQSLCNIRDLGGINVKSGRKVRPHRLIRSEELFGMCQSDQRLLVDRFGLKTIVDFRSLTERAKKPNPPMQGVEDIAHPIFEQRNPQPKRPDNWLINGLPLMLKERGVTPHEFMLETYRSHFVSDHAVSQYKKFMDILLNHETGALLWHCTFGKDRTGMAALFILHALGAEEDAIIEDYLLTNKMTQAKIQSVLDGIEDAGLRHAVHVITTVQEEYLHTGIASISEAFGSLEQFMRDALQVTDKKKARLRELYLQ